MMPGLTIVHLMNANNSSVLPALFGQLTLQNILLLLV